MLKSAATPARGRIPAPGLRKPAFFTRGVNAPTVLKARQPAGGSVRRSPPQQTEGPQRCAQPPFIVTRRWSRALSPPGAQGDAVHHALHLLLIPQDVGLHGADLVLLVADQLLQLGQLRPQWLHGTVRDAGGDKTAVSTWPRLARASSSRQWKAATASCSPHPEKKRKYFLKPLNYGCREGPRDGREGSSEARRR